MSLYTALPITLKIDGTEYPIETDFRFWVNVYQIITSAKSNEQKAAELESILNSLGLPLSSSSVDALAEFFVCGSKGGKGEASQPIFDFEKDSEYIFSAFLTAYNIDLTVDKLHWFKFMALFKSLPDDCQMCKIMHYRAVKINDVPKSQQKFYREMKARYSLNRSETPMTLEERNEMMKQRLAQRFEEAKKKAGDKNGGWKRKNQH